MGTGVLALPNATARLGWALGIVAAILFAAAAVAAGLMLAHVRNAHYPHAASYADLAAELVGPRCGRATSLTISLTWLALLPYYLLACVDAAKLVASDQSTVCVSRWSAVFALCLVLPLQLRSFHELSLVSLASSLAVILGVALTVCALGATAAPDVAAATAATTSLWPRERDPLALFSALTSFIYAYQGHSMFLEMMREMREPRAFPKALVSANAVMSFVYVLTAATGYAQRGDEVAGFLPDSIPAGVVRQAVGLLLAFHTAVAYLLTALPLHWNAMRGLFPVAAENVATGVVTPSARRAWLAITCGTLAFSLLVANAVPFFAALQGLLGSLTGAPIIFGWPPFFYLYSCRVHRQRLSSTTTLLCLFLLFVCAPLFVVLGTANSVGDIWAAHAHSAAQGGSPAACAAGF